MNRWEQIDRAEVPGGTGVIALMRNGAELAIWVDGRELMHSQVHGSEDALADLAYDRLRGRTPTRVLVGGLGMGFTLAAALRRAGPEDEVVLAELVPEIIAWHHGPLAAVSGRPIDDPRATVRNEDVARVIGEAPAAFDAILLDVDNGPDGLTKASNDGLYSRSGLALSRRALRPGGILSVWSAAPDDGFKRRMRQTGFDVEEVVVRARGAKGGRKHTLWLGRVDG